MSSSQQALDLDEVFVFLDGFDLVAPACYDTSTCDTTSSSTSTSPSVSGHGSATDSDDALLSLLNDSGPFELAFACDTDLHSSQHMQQSSPAAQYLKPQSKTRKKEKKTAPAMKATAVPGAPAVIMKRPRKQNRLEIIKLRQELEELQVQHSSLQMTQKRQRSAGIASYYNTSSKGATRMQWREPSTTSNIITQHSFGPTIVGSGAPRSLSFEHAVEQYKALQQSKSLNRKLRDAVTQQLKVTNSMQSVFQKRVPRQVCKRFLRCCLNEIERLTPALLCWSPLPYRSWNSFCKSQLQALTTKIRARASNCSNSCTRAPRANTARLTSWPTKSACKATRSRRLQSARPSRTPCAVPPSSSR